MKENKNSFKEDLKKRTIVEIHKKETWLKRLLNKFKNKKR